MGRGWVLSGVLGKKYLAASEAEKRSVYLRQKLRYNGNGQTGTSMKISGFGTVNSTSNVNKKRGVGASGLFSELLSASESAESSATTATSDVAAASSLSNLLALQEISEEDVQKRKLVKQGHSMLDSLEQLRRQILTGAVPQQTLLDISRQLSVQKQGVVDPKLIEIIEDIELRTAVELAKLEMAAASVALPDVDGV